MIVPLFKISIRQRTTVFFSEWEILLRSQILQRIDMMLCLSLNHRAVLERFCSSGDQRAGVGIFGVIHRMQNAPVLEQKLMIRQVLDGITVDRASDRLECRLLRIPRLENAVLKRINQSVQSNVCPEPST